LDSLFPYILSFIENNFQFIPLHPYPLPPKGEGRGERGEGRVG